MDTQNLMKIIVGSIVVVILFSVVLIPAIQIGTDTTKTYINEGTPFSLADSEDADTHTITIKASDLPAISVDGTLVTSEFAEYSIAIGEHSILRFTASTGRLVLGGFEEAGGTQYFKDLRPANSENDATITVTGTTLTVVCGSTTSVIEDNWAYVDPEGDYVYCLNPHVVANSRIIGGGVTYSPFSSATVICFQGTPEELTDYGIYRSSPTATIVDYQINTTEIDGTLLQIDSIVFNCTQSDTSKTATYTYFLAPKEIVYDNPEYVGSTNAALLNIVPLIVLVGLVLGVVGAAISRRD